MLDDGRFGPELPCLFDDVEDVGAYEGVFERAGCGGGAAAAAAVADRVDLPARFVPFSFSCAWAASVRICSTL